MQPSTHHPNLVGVATSFYHRDPPSLPPRLFRQTSRTQAPGGGRLNWDMTLLDSTVVLRRVEMRVTPREERVTYPNLSVLGQ